MTKVERDFVMLEMGRYWHYKRLLEEQREQILDGSPCPDGQPGGSSVANPTERKAMQLTALGISVMAQRVEAVDRALGRLGEEYRGVFELLFLEGEVRERIWEEKLHLSSRTVLRRRKRLVETCAVEMGIGMME